MTREYPTEIAGPYEAPPRSVIDKEGRDVEVRRYDGGFGEVVEMYLAFDPADRAQGIPPTDEEATREWLESLLGTDCINVLARHEGRVVGHAVLVPDRHGEHELAIFVLQEYQEAGIGTRLMRTLLWHGAEVGVGRVWLTVERWNTAAINLYEKIGFVASDPEGFELEMSARLASPD